MARILFTCLFIGYSIVAFAQGNAVAGIQFFEGSWPELVQAAKQQNKMIFVDVYTDWCAPCKQMNKSVFTAKAVGEKYNPPFLNYRLNAEKGEGIQLAKQFNVEGYPTFLYLNSKGDLLHRRIGYMEPAELNDAADKAIEISADTMTISTMEDAFNQGKRGPAFLRSYIMRLKKLKLDNNKVLEAYFKSLSWQELGAEANVSFLGGNVNSVNSAVLSFVMDKYATLSKKTRLDLTPSLFELLMDHGANDALKNNRMGELKQFLAWADLLEGRTEKQRWYQDRVRMIYAGMIRNAALVKECGYRLIKSIAGISIDSARREDARRFAKFMEPFLNGEKDSTQFSTWNEERPYLVKMYSNEIGYKFYFIANGFEALPDGEKKALEDALAWARKAKELDGNKVYGELAEKLERRVGR